MLSREIYKSFLKTVVRQGVFSEDEINRSATPLADKELDDIRSGKRLDHRLPYLARISGKGGTDSRGKQHTDIRNVSLLEHVTSVARGALVFAEKNLRTSGVDEVTLGARLARVTAVGFLHDADKMLGRGRKMPNATDVRTLMERYCVDAFLAAWKAGATADWMLAMIDQAEVSRAGRLVPGGIMLSPQENDDARYVRCADRVEGVFLAKGPAEALEELYAFELFERSAWRILDIYQPHIPFLLDALHIGFANACINRTGAPPLIETHQDGRLIAILPDDKFEAIRADAIDEVARRFQAVPRVAVNHRWAIELHDARTAVKTLRDAVSEGHVRLVRDLSKLLAVKAKLAAEGSEIRSSIDDMVGSLGFSIRWPSEQNMGGAFVKLLPGEEDWRHEDIFTHARMLAVGLRCEPRNDKSLTKTPPDTGEREAELMSLLNAHNIDISHEIRDLDDKITRISILALIAAAKSEQDLDPDLYEALFGHAGLLERWLDAINASLPENPSEQFVEPVREMLSHAIGGRFTAASENASRRCHFTNMPVEEDAKYISKSEGIYALKVSAFSGREGRPESHRSASDKGTYLSPLARAEHTLRFRQNDNDNRNGKHVPFLLSSPSVSGLFASLTLGPDTEITEISTYDLCARDPRKVRVSFDAVDQFERRFLIARYENHETGLAEAIDMVRRIFDASLRTGRSVHVFQGAPHDVRDRVYFDAMPHEIERGLRDLGGNGFRIEDLETARNRLRTWDQVCRVNGLGVAAATAMMDPATRLAALCEAVAHIDRSGNAAHSALRFNLLAQAQGQIMTDPKASPIVRFARAMTGFQSAPHRESSQADRTRGMRLALDALDSVSVARTTDRETMICAVIAEIENAAERETDKQYTARREGDPLHKEALTCAAEIFADEVWPKVFSNRPPDSKTRRSAIGIYRVAFERAHALRKGGETVFPV